MAGCLTNPQRTTRPAALFVPSPSHKPYNNRPTPTCTYGARGARSTDAKWLCCPCCSADAALPGRPLPGLRSSGDGAACDGGAGEGAAAGPPGPGGVPGGGVVTGSIASPAAELSQEMPTPGRLPALGSSRVGGRLRGTSSPSTRPSGMAMAMRLAPAGTPFQDVSDVVAAP